MGSKPVDPVAVTHCWVDRVVVGLQLCPFAKRELDRQRLRFSLTAAENEEQLLEALADELRLLDAADPEMVTNTLLIHPNALGEFDAYNQFLGLADALLAQLGFDGVFQIASFHPHYRFADTAEQDASNYTNRSPYPMLHLIREDSVADAVARHPDIDRVPVRNVELLRGLGETSLQKLLRDCEAESDQQ